MEGEQVQQVVVRGAGDDLEAAHAVGVAPGIQRLDGAQVGDLAEQRKQLLGLLHVLQRPDLVCFTLTTNHASQRVMEKVGFRYECNVLHAGLPHVFYRLTASAWRAMSAVGG